MGSTAADKQIADLLRAQDGVISRAQALEAGLQPFDISRLQRRKDWTRMMDGIYVNHTGAPSWRQRAWAGVLRYDAALAGHAALRVTIGSDWRHHRDNRPIALVVREDRHVVVDPVYTVKRISDFEGRVLLTLSPPRLRIEQAILDLAAAADSETDSVGLLADACQTGRTTAERIAVAATARSRVRNRAWLLAVLRDIADGTCSVLEHGFLDRVERPHGLPCADRQAPEVIRPGSVRRDADYAPYPLVVELDGGLFHDDPEQRDRDLERDLWTTVGAVGAGRVTIRLGWGQVFDRPCQTAAAIGTLLQRLGWTGAAAECPGCERDAA